jgi:tetratricopeptide (TPR) repeat protein
MTAIVQARRLVLLPRLAAAPAASALTIEYAPDRAAELRACDDHLYRGRNSEAVRCYAALIAGNADPGIMADAARAAGDPRAANTYFRSAVAARPEDAALRTRWGELFLAAHNQTEALTLFREALEIDPDYAPATVGLAKIAANGFAQETREFAGAVIDNAPDASVEAYLVLARADLEDGALDAAEEKLDAAMEIVERRSLPPLEVWAYRAALDFLRNVEESPWTARALEYNPRYGGIYAIPAHFNVITRRYREAVDLLKKAVEIEPTLYSAHAELGFNLLRDNKVREAREHLLLAREGDPFSVPVNNTLNLIDSFENFVVLEHRPEAIEGEFTPRPDVITRLHKSESAVLAPYVVDLTRRAIDVYTERYGFELKEPVVAELYPEHDDFAVRTSGLPGIGLLGVTFGYLVAMDSPTGRADTDFHWGTTLWHEIAHVFTLEATGHLVPRWFSEGVSVHEEWSTGPLPGRHIPPPFFMALKDDMLLPVSELDRGFIRPTYQNQVIVSYMQAGLICEYIASRFGQTALEAMLGLFAEGKDTAEALTGAIGISPEEFDTDFAAHVDGLFGTVAANLEEWQEALRAAYEAMEQEDWDGAMRSAERAIMLHPDYVDDGSAYLVKARVHKERGAQG